MLAFIKARWRIALAIFATFGFVVMPFAGETPGDKVGGTLFYLVSAVVFWTLHIRYTRRTAPPPAMLPEPAPLLPEPVEGSSHLRSTTPVDDAWGRQLATCRRKVETVYEVSAATRAESVRGWLTEISNDVAAQLVLADDIASLGRTVEPGFTGVGLPQNPAAAEAWSRLVAFECGVDDAITSAAQIRLNASQPVTDFGLIHGQLEMLKSQLPTLDVPR
ncbi:MAG: hypothetical protein WAW85_05825 [Gordonia sp. (in: high G+C Gram-positive bacteria)]|uniref:hypothetical protein n=1 Tax=Gordonia sp. (in: high G+C Gram-positive bacteria) TaxID=84139 RepID=UPI003BB53253